MFDILKETVSKFFNKPVEINGTHSKSSDNKLNKGLEKERKIEISSPTSFRTKYTSSNFSDGSKTDIGLTETSHLNNNEKAKAYGIPSTAVKEIEYNPSTRDCKVTFTSNPKKYNYKMSKEEFEEFYNAPSKGRHVNNVMKYNNRDPAYN